MIMLYCTCKEEDTKLKKHEIKEQLTIKEGILDEYDKKTMKT